MQTRESNDRAMHIYTHACARIQETDSTRAVSHWEYNSNKYVAAAVAAAVTLARRVQGQGHANERAAGYHRIN